MMARGDGAALLCAIVAVAAVIAVTVVDASTSSHSSGQRVTAVAVQG
jgi:hypothetical protein